MADSLWLNDEVDANGNPLGVVQYTARELRRALSALMTKAGSPDRFGARSGVHPSGVDAVSLSGSTITVRNSTGVLYTAQTTETGPYAVQILEATHTLAAADGANDRIDLVVVHQYDHDEDGSGQRTLVSEYITGTPGTSPSPPPVPAGADEWAQIYVPADGTGSPTLTPTAHYHVAAGGVVPVRDDSELPGTDGGVYDGLVRWDRSVDALQVHNGAATWETVASANGYQYWKQELYTTNATWDPSDSSRDGWRAIRVRCQGGGGAGGGAGATASGEGACGGGGEGGAYAESWLLRSDVTSSVSISIGGGGAGVSGGDGNNGGATSFGSLVSASGGDGGSAASVHASAASLSGAVSSPAMTGDIQIEGGGGGAAQRNAGASFGGTGGDTMLGTGGRGAGQNVTGGFGNGFGGGGGGSANGDSGDAAKVGGSGAGGICIVDLFV